MASTTASCLCALALFFAGCSRATLALNARGSSSSHASSSGAGGSGGSGGAGGSGGSMGGAGGTGGILPEDWPCPLAIAGPVGVAGGAGFHQLQPRLAYSNATLDQVTVAMEWQHAEGPAVIPSELRHVTFSPWSNWPGSDIGLSYLASFDAGVSFAVAPAPGNHFALVASDGGKPTPPPGILYYAPMTPGSGIVPPPSAISYLGDLVLFASARGDTVLAAGNVADATKPALMATFGPAFGKAKPLACASGLRAAAVPAGDGWLVAVAAASGTFGAFDCSNLKQLDPSVIYVVRVSSDWNATPVAVNTVVGNGKVTALSFVALPGGDPWLVWQGLVGTAPADYVTRFNKSGAQLFAPVALQGAPGVGNLTAAPFLDGLLVAHGPLPVTTSFEYVFPEGTTSCCQQPPQLPASGALASAIPTADGSEALFAGSIIAAEARIRLLRVGCAKQ